MTQEELLRLARLGAEARLQELQVERQTIHAAFPDLRNGASTQASSSEASANGQGTVRAVTKRRRPKMSTEARQRIGDAQRKRWAAWKAKQGTAEGASQQTDALPAVRSAKKR